MGGSSDLGEIVASLTAAGYERASQVEGTGQFALRGRYSTSGLRLSRTR